MGRWTWVGVLVLTTGLLGGARPAAAQTTITGGSELLTQAYANQLGAWLGEGPITINRIFTKSAGMNSSHFHGAVDGKGRTFAVIEATGALGTRIVGGYNPQSWDSHGHWHFTASDAQRTAFIFNLTQGFKQDQKKSNDSTGTGSNGEYQTLNTPDLGPVFGAGADLFVNGSLTLCTAGAWSYGTNNPTGGAGGMHIFGSTGYWELTAGRIEVFTIGPGQATPAVPEPASMMLFLPALAVAGFNRRRRAQSCDGRQGETGVR